jgi:hypothetical protein
MKKSGIKRTLSAILAVAILACGALTATASAITEQPVTEVVQEIIFEPFASEHLRAWSPLLSRTSYGAQVTFVGTRSGSIQVELQNSAGTRIASFTETFTNRTSIGFTRNRNTPTGTYRIVIHVTIT